MIYSKGNKAEKIYKKEKTIHIKVKKGVERVRQT